MNTVPRPEYPRPQFVRKQWMNLNGVWQFEIDFGDSGREQDWQKRAALAGEITVPFCPESDLSGVRHRDFIRACWYRREVILPESWLEGAVLLHFGAVNYESTVWVNGVELAVHEGGYSSFTVDITRAAKPGANIIVVLARSDVRAGRQPSGKQSQHFHSHGCFYTRTTGIWQTVWLEGVPKKYIARAQWIPDPDNGGFHLTAEFDSDVQGVLTVRPAFEGRDMGASAFKVCGRAVSGFVPVGEAHLWSVEDPALYDMELRLESEGCVDAVQSYAGLRSVQWTRDGLFLNHEPLYMRLVLDQGYYPGGVITAPDDEDLKSDVLRAKAMGFNGARLHQKMFEPRFLYWADRLGYVVWGEHGNWGMDISDAGNMPRFLMEWIEFVRRDISSPALIGWCPLNETQQDADPSAIRSAYRVTRAIDPSRPVIDTSGWVHGEETDIYDYHDYIQDGETLRQNLEIYASVRPGEPFAKCRMPWMQAWNLKMTVSKDQPIFLSEFGGVGWIMGGIPENRWGYGGLPESEEAFFERFEGLIRAALAARGVCGFCYTQLTDVEQEINGLYTYDRIPKFPPERIAAILTRRAWNE